jgi:hypothetical protein
MPANNSDLHINKAARPISNLKLSNFNIGSISLIHMVVGLCGVTANVFAPTAIDPSDGWHVLVSSNHCLLDHVHSDIDELA